MKIRFSTVVENEWVLDIPADIFEEAFDGHIDRAIEGYPGWDSECLDLKDSHSKVLDADVVYISEEDMDYYKEYPYRREFIEDELRREYERVTGLEEMARRSYE